MTAYNGNAFLLKIGTSGTAGTQVGAMRTTSFQINNEIVDITDKDAAGWRTILDLAGRKSISASVEGVMTDSTTLDAMATRAHSGTITAYGLVFGDSDLIDGSFKVTNFSATGPVDAEQTYSFNLESSGSMTLTTA